MTLPYFCFKIIFFPLFYYSFPPRKSKKRLEKDFNSIPNKNFEHYYEIANFYKDNEYYEKSIEYYSLALKKIDPNHFLVRKIYDRIGTSYERLNDWENAEKDLLKSLEI